MESEPPKVLISYSHDSPEHAQHVLELAERLRKDGVDAQLDQYVAGAPPEGWPRWMLNRLDWAEFVLVVCTEAYYRSFRGHEEPSKGKGADWEGNLITLAMYDAKSTTTKFAPVLFDGQNEQFIPEPLRGHTRHLLNSETNYTKLYAFLTGQTGVTPGELGSLKTLARNSVEPLRFESSKEHGRSMGKLHGVPNLPPYYLPREKVLAGLKQKLVSAGANVAITGQGTALGVQGMGGIGKTVLAAALAHDSDVRQAFPDGIFWVTIGQTPNLFGLQGQLVGQMTGTLSTFVTKQQGYDGVRDALEGRRALVVVDDAWTVDDADAFFVRSAPTARLLITTRNNEVLVGLGAKEYRVDVLSSSDALKMLAEWVGEKSPDKLPPEAAEVAKECGYLPLALAMIGAMIRLRPAAWKDALTRLRRADLGAIKKAFPNYLYPDLLRAIEVSIEALEETDRESYLDLAVFPEDQPIPEEALRMLWKLDEVDIRDCMTHLVSRSLATWGTDGTSLILHDLQRDLIHKRRERVLPGLHLRLLESWDALPKLPDAYAWRWIGYHMVRAGRKDDLRRLLLDFDWLQAKLAATDPNVLIADYDYLADEEELRTIQSALRLSAHVLARDPRQLGGQLTGRLLGDMAPSIRCLLKQAAQNKAWSWLRPLAPTLTAPGGPLIRTLEVRAPEPVPYSHPDSFSAVVAVTADGRRAVSESSGTLRLWDLESGQTIHTLEGHTDTLMAVMPDGRRALSASQDNTLNTLRLWDLESGETIRTLKGHTDWVNAVAATADGRRALSASQDKTLRLWDLDSGQTLRTLEGHTDSVNAVAVTTDGRRALSASQDATLRLWDLESGQTIRTLEGHTNWVKAVAVTADGLYALSGSKDNTLRLWDLESGQTVCTLEGHTDRVSTVAVTPDGCRAVSASEDRTLRLWDLESGQNIRTSEGHTGFVWALTVTADGRRALSASEDKTLRLWDLESGQTIRTLEGHTNWVKAVAVTADGRHALSASVDATLRLWDLESGQNIRTLENHTGGVYAVTVTADGRRALSASQGHTLGLWDLESGQIIRTLVSNTSFFYPMAVTPDGRRALSGSGSYDDDNTLRFWDFESGQTIRTLEGHTNSVWAVAVTADGRRAVSASWDATLRLWDLESGRNILTLVDPAVWAHSVVVTLEGPVLDVAVTADGRRALSGSSTLRLWDFESGKEIAAFTGESSISRCAFAPDGCTIVAATTSGRVHFLEVVEADETKPATGETKMPLLLHKEQASLNLATDS